jgi:hypothetical protein
MLSNTAFRRIANEDFLTDDGVTTVSKSRRPEPEKIFDKFWSHYNVDPEQKWQVEVLKHLVRYATLSPGWDSYTGLPLRLDAGFFALWLLNDIMRPRTPMPQVVPSPVGGVQLEWHEKNIDLELHIAAPYECELWFEDHQTGERISRELSNDFSLLAVPIAQLTSR